MSSVEMFPLLPSIPGDKEATEDQHKTNMLTSFFVVLLVCSGANRKLGTQSYHVDVKSVF